MYTIIVYICNYMYTINRERQRKIEIPAKTNETREMKPAKEPIKKVQKSELKRINNEEIDLVLERGFKSGFRAIAGCESRSRERPV